MVVMLMDAVGVQEVGLRKGVLMKVSVQMSQVSPTCANEKPCVLLHVHILRPTHFYCHCHRFLSIYVFLLFYRNL